MNPQMMFLVNFLSSMSNLAGQVAVPYQVLLNAQEGSKEKEAAFTTLDKVHRAMEIVLLEIESKITTQDKKNILRLVNPQSESQDS
jgi:hypothetical protein